MRGYVHGDSGEIGFVLSCLYRGAIKNNDFTQWTYSIISKYNELPLYIYDLADFDGNRLHLERIIGFSPYWNASEKEKLTLYGIAYKRGFEPYDCPLTKEEALKKLEQHPHIEKKFREMFPFIEF